MKRRSQEARDLRTPKYRPRVVRDRTKYTRKPKHKSGRVDENGKHRHVERDMSIWST